MKQISIYLIIFFIVISCSNKQTSCTEINGLNKIKTESIKEYYNKIESWNLNNWRMKFLEGYISNFQIGFDSLNQSIINRDELLFNSSKESIHEEINYFLTHTSEVKPWINNEYFWIIQKAKNDIKSLIASEKCFEVDLINSLEIEEKLVSTFYLLGYSDQYCFNKMEPIVHSFDLNSKKDTLSFTIGNYAYDSTLCAKVVYEASSDNLLIKDSTNCNWFDIPRKSGDYMFKGRYYTEFYGKKHELDFKQELFIK